MAGLPPCIFIKSENFASKPIDTNANANHTVRKLFNMPLTCLVVPEGIKKEKINDTIIKPTTNFGKRSHTIAKPGFSFFSFFPPTVLKRLTYFEASEAPIRQFRCDQFVVRSWHMLCCRNICVNELLETRP